ncbi:MAG: hypothetical protein OSJ38_00805 [Lachnospiraceae bacterium]|nr:hypothetical protein [Lachnospiraceae bacterium]
MRKKYRKLTFYLVLLVMGVGMVIFPIRDNGMGDGRGEEDDAAETNALPRVYAGSGLLPAVGIAAPTPMPATPSPSPTPSPTPIPTPSLAPKENTLLEELPKDLVSFVEQYFSVRLTGTSEEYRALFYNKGELDEQLTNKRVEYIVDYHNLKCYAKLGVGEVDYVVYVENDVEIATIDTYAPSIDQLFIKYDEKGKPKLYLYDGSFTDEEEAYYEALRSSGDVVALVEDVNARLEEAIASDEALRDFFARLSQESGETQE